MGSYTPIPSAIANWGRRSSDVIQAEDIIQSVEISRRAAAVGSVVPVIHGGNRRDPQGYPNHRDP